MTWWGGAILASLLVVVAIPGVAQTPSPPPGEAADPFVLLGQGPWPGMTALDVVWCKELVFAAQVVEVREPGQKPRNVWVKDARGWLKPNGFYGLRLNGQPVDEAAVWLEYGGAMVNLRVLFTYGSVPVAPVSPFRD